MPDSTDRKLPPRYLMGENAQVQPDILRNHQDQTPPTSQKQRQDSVRGKIPSEHLGQICEIAVLAWMRAVILRLAGIVEFRLHVSRGVESLGHGRIRNPRGPGLTVHHREVITTV